ncbi:MAG: hypothetical protein A2Z72_01390 [Omnitrophica bacterium RBG_13_46_9]|nr:MAG: hypothetical protein A2Z72_01390 [Omnitrophica bacterium RBG_13_46_9]
MDLFRRKTERPSIFRVSTAPFRLLPDFLIIGGMKCGTDSLYFNLIKHPNVHPAFIKETYFFCHYYHCGLEWYRSHFPLALWKKANRIMSRSFVTGEASPKYLFDMHVPKRVYQHLPRVRLIVLLRNPVDRAFSHYRMRARKGGDRLSFEKALENEEKRIQDDFLKRCENEHYSAKKYWVYSYKARGIYVDQLKRWNEYFKREDMLILNSEEFDADTEKVYYKVLEFLGLPLWRPRRFEKFNVAAGNLEMEKNTRKRLIEYFRPHNERLYEWLGYRFDWDR